MNGHRGYCRTAIGVVAEPNNRNVGPSLGSPDGKRADCGPEFTNVSCGKISSKGPAGLFSKPILREELREITFNRGRGIRIIEVGHELSPREPPWEQFWGQLILSPESQRVVAERLRGQRVTNQATLQKILFFRFSCRYLQLTKAVRVGAFLLEFLENLLPSNR